MASPVVLVKPRLVPQVNAAHPLAKDLVLAWVPDGDELLTHSKLALLTNGKLNVETVGVTLRNPDASGSTNASGGKINIPTDDGIFSLTADLSIVLLFKGTGTAATTTKVLHIDRTTAGTNDDLSFSYGATNATAARLKWFNGAVASGESATGFFVQDEWHVYGVNRNLAGGSVAFYRDGLLFGSASGISTTAATYGNKNPLGLLINPGTTLNGSQGDLATVFIFKRQLSDVEHQQIGTNPLALLDYGTDLSLAALGGTPTPNYVQPRSPQKFGGPNPVSRFRSPQAYVPGPDPAPPGSASFWRSQGPQHAFGSGGPWSRITTPPAYFVVVGTVYNDTLTESVSAADSLVAVQVFVEASFSEAATAADALSAQQVFVEGGFTESVSAADSLASSGTWASVIAEAGGAADTLSSTAVFPNSLTEAAAASDAVSGGLLFVEAPSEGVSAAEALTQMQVFAPTLAEAAAVADALIGEGGSDVVPGLGMASLLWWQAWQRRGAVYDEVLAEDVWARAGSSVRPVVRNAIAARIAARAGLVASLAAKARLREAAKARDVVQPQQTHDEKLVESVGAAAEFKAGVQIRTVLVEEAAAACWTDTSLTVRARIRESVAAAAALAGGIWFTRTVNESLRATDVLAAAGYFNPTDEQIAFALLLLDP